MRTPDEIAQAFAENSNERCRMREAIEADRAQLKRLAEGARASVNYNIDNKRTMTDESLTAVKRLCDALGV